MVNPLTFRAELEQFVQEQLAFLVDEKGFHLAPIERMRGFTTFRYLGPQVGFDMTIEYLDSSVIAGLINVHAGASQDPKMGGATAPRLRLQRPFFGALRNALGVIDVRMDQVAIGRADTPWNKDIFETIIRLNSELARDYIDALAQLPTEALFPPQTRTGQEALSQG